MTVPPPTPKRPLKTPATVPIAASRTRSQPPSRDTRCRVRRIRLEQRRRPCRPARAAARRPRADGDPHRHRRHPGADRRAPRAGRGAGARLASCSAELSERYGLVGCVSGRRAEEARRLVGVDGIAYAGNHGLELLLPGDDAPRLDPSLEGAGERRGGLPRRPRRRRAGRAGLRTEDKGPIQALHWRGAEDERAAEARAREIAAEAGRAGLEPHWGRKVLEVRPAGGGGKDAAVAALLAADGVSAAIYAGDDRTDLDAFRRLRDLRDQGELTTAVCVGVTSPEAPPELAEEADLRVDGPAGWLAILEALAA